MFRRFIRWILVVVIIVGALAASATWWLGRTETAAWALERLAAHLEGTMQLEGLRGSLYEGLLVEGAVFESADLRVTLRQAEVKWSNLMAMLFERRIVVEDIAIQTLRIDQKIRTTAPAQPPDSFALPIALTLKRIAIDHITWASPLTRFDAQALRASLAAHADALSLQLESLRTEYGDLAGAARIGAEKPFPIEGSVKIERATGELPFRAEATLGGELALIGVGGFATVDLGTARGAMVLTPFGATLVERVQASTEAFDPAKIRRDWPQARLDITITGRLVPDDRFVGDVAVANKAPGTLDAKRLPLEILTADLEATTASARLTRIVARLGRAGQATGIAHYRPGQLTLDLATNQLNLAGLVATLHPTRLAGTVSGAITEERQHVRGNLKEARLAFEFDATRTGDLLDVRTLVLRAGDGRIDASGQLGLSGEGRIQARGTIANFDPSAIGDFPAARINGEFTAAGRVLKQRDGELQARLRDSRFRGFPLEGSVTARLADDRLTALDLDLLVATNRVTAQGALGAADDSLRWSIDAGNLGRLGLGFEGKVQASGVATGTWSSVASTIALDAASLARPGEWALDGLSAEGRISQDAESTLRLAAKALKLGTVQIDTANANLTGTRAKHRIEAVASGDQIEARGSATGGLYAGNTWRGTIDQLQATRPFAATLEAPATVTIAPERTQLDGARIAIFGGRATIEALSIRDRSIASQGTFAGLNTRDLAPQYLAPSSDLRVSGGWDIAAGETLSGRLAVKRDQGDLIVVTEYGRSALGLTDAALELVADRNRLTGELNAAGQQFGSLTARIETVASRVNGRWGVAGDAPLGGNVSLQTPSIAWLGALTQGTAVLSGAADTRFTLSGTVAQPRPQGTLRATGLRVVLPDSNIVLAKGELAVEVDATTATLRDAIFHGDAGTLNAQGTWQLRAPYRGELALRFDGLDAIADPTRAVKVSGKLDARYAERAVAIRGALRADEGRVRVSDGDAPRLGEDVTVVNAPATRDGRRSKDAGSSTIPVDFDVEADLGERFQLQGRGFEALLSGRLRVRSTNGAAVRLFGPVTVKSGTVIVYGQKLEIERGTVTFNGPQDNPQLNLFAIRTGLPVRVGVQVTGFALEPRATLFSDPPMADNQRLSWLVLGRSAEGLSPADLTLLGTAASAILAGDSPPLQTRIANTIGLDELAVRATGAVESAVVAVGKRVSDKLYVSVERSVLGLGTVLSLRYQFNRAWSLRSETGTNNTVDLFYTLSFD